MKTLLISYSNLGPQLTDTLFTQLVTEGAIQKFEMWKGGHQLLDRRQRHIPDKKLDKISPFQKAQLLNVFSSSAEQII